MRRSASLFLSVRAAKPLPDAGLDRTSWLALVPPDRCGVPPPRVGELSVSTRIGARDTQLAVLQTALRDVVAPKLLSAMADDPDQGDYIYSAGDTVTIAFDRSTDRGGGATSGNKAFVDRLLRFDPPIGTECVARVNSRTRRRDDRRHTRQPLLLVGERASFSLSRIRHATRAHTGMSAPLSLSRIRHATRAHTRIQSGSSYIRRCCLLLLAAAAC